MYICGQIIVSNSKIEHSYNEYIFNNNQIEFSS